MSYRSDAKIIAVKNHFVCALLAGAFFVGCDRNAEIKVYRVAKAPLEESTASMQDAFCRRRQRTGRHQWQ